MRDRLLTYALILFLAASYSCDSEKVVNPEIPPEPTPTPEIFTIPVVIHVIHLGEEVGEGNNLSMEQIESQIRVLNEDFRRKEGTRGYNEHPDGGDSKIEFVLAKKDPDGNPTSGVIRVNALIESDTIKFHNFEYLASLSYWNPEHYLNIWTEPFPEDVAGIVLGQATGPVTDLPGAHLFLDGEPEYREGISINSAHFGESERGLNNNLGRTLTHEVGHYLGLLHLWGTGECITNDYCADTPAMDKAFGSTCGQGSMPGNYMSYSNDAQMNLFTNDQIERMHYVLKNSPYRTTLLTSPGLVE